MLDNLFEKKMILQRLLYRVKILVNFVRFIDRDINIVYEDPYFLIVNKEINLPSIPSRNLEDESLLEIVNYYFKKEKY